MIIFLYYPAENFRLSRTRDYRHNNPLYCQGSSIYFPKGLIVWYDEFELKIGDKLRRKIDEGLRKSRYGIKVNSKKTEESENF